MELLAKYHLYLMIAVLVGLVFLPTEYRKNKLFILTAVIFAFSVGYELIMQEPVTKMPRRITRFLGQSGPNQSENEHYYSDPIETSKRLYKEEGK